MGNIEETKRKARATVYMASDEAYDEILEFIRQRAYIAYTHTASMASKRLVVAEEGH